MQRSLRDAVERSRDADVRAEFDRRCGRQAATVREAIEAGEFDNDRYTIGFELEAYAVGPAGRVARIPASVFETDACAVELGLHNLEVNTAPDGFDDEGVAAQTDAVNRAIERARSALDRADRTLALDGMWTIPPEEGSRAYLGDVEDRDGVTVAANMRRSARYCAIDNDVLEHAGGGIALELPGVSETFPTILAESLTTSVQPHLQVPETDAFPRHYRLAIRTMGPVLALTTNSPFLPADLYADDADPRAVVDRSYHESRIPVFEQTINGTADAAGKVRFPEDIEAATDVVTHLEDDRVCAPFLREWVTDDAATGYTDEIWELDHKRGTYWRWLRAVIGGDPLDGVDERSLRIEYRPIPTQPSVPAIQAIQAFVPGLIRGLAVTDHPLETLPWEAAKRCFYDVVEDGLDAELAWVTREGDRTDDPELVYGELFALARHGLDAQGIDPDRAAALLEPLRERWRTGVTPSRWKRDRVRDALDDGAPLPEAIEAMQREYLERSGGTEPVSRW